MQILSSELLPSRSQDKNLGSVEGNLFFPFNRDKPYMQEVLLHLIKIQKRYAFLYKFHCCQR